MPEDELNERLQYYAMERGRGAGFGGVSRALKRAMPRAMERFYSVIKERPELASFFGGPEHMDRAKKLQDDHWTGVFRDGVEQEFHERAVKIGAVHARIGLEPKWYVGGYALILEELVMAIIAPGWTRYLPWRRAKAQQLVSLIKVSLLDIDLALSGYFVDSEEKMRSIVSGKLGTALEALAAGDLTVRVDDLPPEYSKVQGDFNATVDALRSTLGTVITGVDSMLTGSSEIRSASDDLAQRTEQQAANLEETAEAIANANKHLEQAVDTTSEAGQTIASAHENARTGRDVVARAITAMGEIEKSSEEINTIISVIDSIAFQTNLLALNAGVEAARAGETGKGFAVVANEVRALAQRCTESADEIKALVTQSTEQVSTGVDLVNRSGDSFAKISDSVDELRSSIESIAESTLVQASRLSQINETVAVMDQSTQQNAAMAEQCTAAARSLAGEAGTLSEAVERFELSGKVSEKDQDKEGVPLAA